MMATEIELSPDQQHAQDQILAFLPSDRALITMGGYAGTGKTTVIASTVRQIKSDQRQRIAFCAFTGKAASILRGKLEAAGALDQGDYIGTIHSLIYDPIIGQGGKICGFNKKESIDQEVIIADEASMIDENLFNDLKSYGRPIVAVGDHGQLPPVFGNFNLMEAPQIRLEKIHRQAAEHPIIRLSIMAREDGYIPCGTYGPGVVKVSKDEGWELMKKMDLDQQLVLCGRNETRSRLNRFIRGRCGRVAQDLAGKTDEPLPGDKLICLKNNKREGIWNGMTGVVQSIEPVGRHWYTASITMDNGLPFLGRILKYQFYQKQTIREWEGLEAREFGNLFDFGYCLTVHKAQGSESENVIVIEERMGMQTDDDWRRWLYTAVTRSKERLLIVA